MSIENPSFGDTPESEHTGRPSGASGDVPFGGAAGEPAETIISPSGNSALEHTLTGPDSETAERSDAHTPAERPIHFSLEQFTLPTREITKASARAATVAFIRGYDTPLSRFPTFADVEMTGADDRVTQRWKMELQYKATNGIVLLEPADGELNVKHTVGGTVTETRRYFFSMGGVRCDSRDQSRLLRDVPAIGDAPAEMRWHEAAKALQAAEPDRALEREMGINDQLVGAEEMAYILHMLEHAEPRTVGCNELLRTASRRAASPYAPNPSTRRLALDAFVAGVLNFAQNRNPDYDFRQPFDMQDAIIDKATGTLTEYRVSRVPDNQHNLVPAVEARFSQIATPDILAWHGINRELSPHTQAPRLSTGVQLTVQDKQVVYTMNQRIEDRGDVFKNDHTPPVQADYDLARLARNFLRSPQVFG